METGDDRRRKQRTRLTERDVGNEVKNDRTCIQSVDVIDMMSQLPLPLFWY